MREEAVLLGAIEAMDLVDEKQRPLADLTTRLGPVERLAQILHAREDGRELLELEPRLVGQQAGDAGLAGPRRPPHDHDRKAPSLKHSCERSRRPAVMGLAYDHCQLPSP